jgi:CHAT domain-containing protein/tetratricopeptide (TPR) repeat protein
MRIERLLALGALLAAAHVAVAQPVPLAEEDKALAARAAALNARVEQLYDQDKLAEAAPLAEQALALCRRLYPPGRYPNGHPLLAAALNGQGLVLEARGELAAAEPFYRQALAVCQKLYPQERHPAGHLHLARALNNLGHLLWLRGELAAAEPLLRETIAMVRKLYPPGRDPAGQPELAVALNNLGSLLEARGELAAAEPPFREALEINRRLYPPGRYPAGHPDLALSLNNLGSLLGVRGEHAAAEPLLRKALEMRRQLYPPRQYPAGHPDLAQSLNNLGSLLRARGDLAAAEPLYREALGVKRKLYPAERYPAGHPDLANSLNSLGMLLRARGQPAAAEPLLRQALEMRRNLYPPGRYPAGHPDLAQALNSLGALLQDRGELVAAEPFLREAVRVQQRLTDVLLAGSSEAQALNYLAALPLTRDAYLSVTRQLPDTEGSAYEAVWHGKGALAWWLGQRRLALARAGEPGVVELARVRRDLAALLLAPDAPARDGRLAALARRKEDLERQLARRLPDFARAMGAGRKTPHGLARALPEGSACIDLLRYVRFEYDPARPGLSGERRTPCYAAFVLGRGRTARRVELGPAAPIDRAVALWRAALTGRRGPAPLAGLENEGASEPPERALRRLVWGPLARHLPPGARAVYLAPDAALTGLPWGALPGSTAGTVVLEEYALAVVPSGPFLLEALEAERGQRPAEAGTLLAVGGVAYGQVPEAKAARRELELVQPADLDPALKGRPRWPQLDGARREIERLRALAGKREVLLREGKAAGTEQLLRDLPKARWAHLATHGFFAYKGVRSALQLREKDYERGRFGEKVGIGARSPLVLSGLVLAGANLEGKEAPADRGILTAEAIAGLDLDGLDLVVLSACETGLGEVAGGEGVFGLQRAFHIAGCRNVVASLWQVDDEATAALMALFYHHLWVGKMPPIEALRQAQLTLYHHPERIPALARARGPDFDRVARRPAAASGPRAPARLWAGFVLSGAGR